MKTVNQLLQVKGDHVWTVSPDETVFNALKLMAERDIGAVLVLDDDQVAGIMSERDYARKVILQGKASQDTPVREIMSEEVICVRPDQTVRKCMALMTDKRFRHLPVLDKAGELAGIISIGDVVKAIIQDQEVMINHLEDYITGSTR